MGVHVHHYHADNGRFCEKEMTKAVKYNGHTISFYGVSAHLQNGKVEKRIRDLQDQARKMLLHATSRCPQAITAHLYPMP